MALYVFCWGNSQEVEAINVCRVRFSDTFWQFICKIFVWKFVSIDFLTITSKFKVLREVPRTNIFQFLRDFATKMPKIGECCFSARESTILEIVVCRTNWYVREECIQISAKVFPGLYKQKQKAENRISL